MMEIILPPHDISDRIRGLARRSRHLLQDQQRRRLAALVLSLSAVAAVLVGVSTQGRSRPALAAADPSAGVLSTLGSVDEPGQQASELAHLGGPQFVVDPSWPNYAQPEELGSIGGLHVDHNDVVWISHRGHGWGTAKTVPPVLAFNASTGALVESWGGPGEGFDWPESEHGVFATHDGHVWVHGGLPFIPGFGHEHYPPAESVHDAMLVKFTRAGEFVQQIGRPFASRGNKDTANFNRPGQAVVDPVADELYVADGHGNRRVIVLDAQTGAFKRLWGSHGRDPDDPSLTATKPSTWGIVHSIAISHDRLVYVGDRAGGMVEVFFTNGTFVTEVAIEPEFDDVSEFNGPWSLGFSHDAQQQYLFVTNGITGHVNVLERRSLRKLSHFGSKGAGATKGPGEFKLMHSVGSDSQGNLFVTETGGMPCRVQKFRRVG